MRTAGCLGIAHTPGWGAEESCPGCGCHCPVLEGASPEVMSQDSQGQPQDRTEWSKECHKREQTGLRSSYGKVSKHSAGAKAPHCQGLSFLSCLLGRQGARRLGHHTALTGLDLPWNPSIQAREREIFSGVPSKRRRSWARGEQRLAGRGRVWGLWRTSPCGGAHSSAVSAPGGLFSKSSAAGTKDTEAPDLDRLLCDCLERDLMKETGCVPEHRTVT